MLVADVETPLIPVIPIEDGAPTDDTLTAGGVLVANDVAPKFLARGEASAELGDRSIIGLVGHCASRDAGGRNAACVAPPVPPCLGECGAVSTLGDDGMQKDGPGNTFCTSGRAAIAL